MKGRTYNINREIGELKTNTKESFNKIRTDVSEIEQEISEIKNSLKVKK